MRTSPVENGEIAPVHTVYINGYCRECNTSGMPLFDLWYRKWGNDGKTAFVV